MKYMDFLEKKLIEIIQLNTDNLNSFLQICSTVVATAPGTPIVPLNLAANQLSIQLKVIQGNLEKLKSDTVKTV